MLKSDSRTAYSATTAPAMASTTAPTPASHLPEAAPVKTGPVGAVSVGVTTDEPLPEGPGNPVPDATGAVPTLVPVKAVASAEKARMSAEVENCILNVC